MLTQNEKEGWGKKGQHFQNTPVFPNVKLPFLLVIQKLQHH